MIKSHHWRFFLTRYYNLFNFAIYHLLPNNNPVCLAISLDPKQRFTVKAILYWAITFFLLFCNSYSETTTAKGASPLHQRFQPDPVQTSPWVPSNQLHKRWSDQPQLPNEQAMTRGMPSDNKLMQDKPQWTQRQLGLAWKTSWNSTSGTVAQRPGDYEYSNETQLHVSKSRIN